MKHNIIAFADIPNGYADRWVRVAFSIEDGRAVCSHKDGSWHYCAFLPKVADEEELLYCINPENRLPYRKYLRRVVTRSDHENRHLYNYDIDLNIT